MDERFHRKYKRVLEVIADVAECADGKLILVGGTALALFYLRHRISLDLDFVPVGMDETGASRALKGCLSKKGYRATRGIYANQFVLQFQDTGIKIEVFEPETPVREYTEIRVGDAKLKVATVEEIFRMKIDTYIRRREARDIYDILFMMKEKGDFSQLAEILRSGQPKNMETLGDLVDNKENYEFFVKVMKDASKTSD